MIVEAICPPNELLCPDGTCTKLGVCLAESLRPLAMYKNKPPTIRLLGNSTVRIPQGVRYTTCWLYNGSTVDVCDPGVVAKDAEDGNLTPRVLACSPAGAEAFRFFRVGIRGCEINTEQPGRYTVGGCHPCCRVFADAWHLLAGSSAAECVRRFMDFVATAAGHL